MTTANIQHEIPVVSLQLVRDRSVQYGTSSVSKPDEVCTLFSRAYGEPDRELFVIVSLDTRNKPTTISMISQGTINSSLVHPREVFKTALLANAASIVLIHNHPSGDSSPSPEDLTITRRLVRAGQLLGVEVVDHVIIGDGNYTSLRERGFLSA